MSPPSLLQWQRNGRMQALSNVLVSHRNSGISSPFTRQKSKQHPLREILAKQRGSFDGIPASFRGKVHTPDLHGNSDRVAVLFFLCYDEHAA